MPTYEIEYVCEGQFRTWDVEAWDAEEALGIFWEYHDQGTLVLGVEEVVGC